MHETPKNAIFHPFRLAEAGATDLVDPTDQSLGPLREFGLRAWLAWPHPRASGNTPSSLVEGSI